MIDYSVQRPQNKKNDPIKISCSILFFFFFADHFIGLVAVVSQIPLSLAVAAYCMFAGEIEFRMSFIAL